MRIKIKLNQVKKILGKLPLAVAQRAFLACLLLFFLALIFGAILFYKYNILAQRAEFEILDKPVLLKEKIYQEVLSAWQEQERISREADSKEYPDPFKGLTE